MKNFRFFIKPEDIVNDFIMITGENHHKIKNVLRYKIGDELDIILAGDSTKKFRGKIEKITDETIIVRITDSVYLQNDSIFTTLYISLLKSKNFEVAIQKATELGVKRIVPLSAKRSIVQVKNERESGKIQRWRAIAMEAAAQCKRDDVPDVTDIIDSQKLKTLHDDAQIKFVCHEKGGESLKEYFARFKNPIKISALIGPEGGFTDEEVRLFNNLGFTSVLLGKSVLRAETVPIYIMSIIQYEFAT